MLPMTRMDRYGTCRAHPPHAPRDTQLGATAIGTPLKMMVIPLWLLPLGGLSSRFMKEVADVSFTWDRPYRVDASKFKRRFWADVTPFEVGAPATARSFMSAAKATATSFHRRFDVRSFSITFDVSWIGAIASVASALVVVATIVSRGVVYE